MDSSIKDVSINNSGFRFRFVVIFSVLAAIYGGILAYRLLHHQSDAMSDVIKMSVVVFFAALIASSFWSIVMASKIKTRFGGMIVGSLSAISVIPIPTFLGAFKNEWDFHPNLISALSSGLTYSVSTFSLAEALAIPLSAAVGYWLVQ